MMMTLSSWIWCVTPASLKIGLFLIATTTRCLRCSRLLGRWRFIAEDHHGTLVGAVWTYHGSPPLRCDAAGVPLPELCIAVAPGHRGVGIGGMLLDVLFADLAKGYDAICTNVHVRNPVKRLYERKGFRVVGQGNGPLGLALVKDLR
jgi:ribosomal protein S18 acetylase RimI-like enzyme